MIDFEEDAVDASEVGSLGEVSELARQLVTMQDEVKDLESMLKNRKEDLRKLQEQTLPDALIELGLSEVALENGVKIETKQFYRASIPKAKEDEAFAWLRDNGHGDLVKHVVSLRFDREEDEQARELIEDLRDKGLDPENKQSVHPMTLRAFARERIEAGEDIPHDLLGVYVGQQATVKK